MNSCLDLEESDLQIIYEQCFARRRATKAAVNERHDGVSRALEQGDKPAVLQGLLLLERLGGVSLHDVEKIDPNRTDEEA